MSSRHLVNWHRRNQWLLSLEPETELLQAEQEGRKPGPWRQTLQRLVREAPAALEDPERFGRWMAQNQAALDAVQQTPIREDYPFVEPDDWSAIRRASAKGVRVPAWTGSRKEYAARVHGGLLGRICGCMLGKPVEGWWREEIQATARATDGWPIEGYLRFPTAAEARRIARSQPRNRLHSDRHRRMTLPGMNGMVEDDDINYTVIGFDVVKQFGPDFDTQDIAVYWGFNLPILRACTAERVAYRNLFSGVVPPASATFRNPYREWIGAQIRADFFGYANPGDPDRAAAWAWRDARMTHVRNGIYGAMWVASMLAAAFVAPDWPTVLRAGLARIPTRSRLHRDVTAVLDMHRDGASYDEAVAFVHKQWNERIFHDWCHTNSNAQVVAIGLVYGNDDYGLTVCRAVMAGFDTDCNGATCGSLWGVRHGVAAIPERWTRPIADQVRTWVTGWQTARISELAAAMADLGWKTRAS